MIRLFLFSLFFAILNTTYCDAAPRTFTTRTPVYNSYNYTQHKPYRHYNKLRTNNHRRINKYANNNFSYHHNSVPTSSFSDINALENYTFNKRFPRESKLQRLERLENRAFGAIQNGDINSRYENVRNAILSRPKQNHNTSLLRNLGNFFGGQMTGYTPTFTPSFTSTEDQFFSSPGFSSSPFPSTFGSQTIREYSGPFGRHQSFGNFGTGSSSGITILD